MHKKSRGFLLVELLVTLALLAMVAPPLLNLVLLGGQTLTIAYRQTVAINLAREALEWQRSAGFCGSENWLEEEVIGFREFSRELKVTRLPLTEPAWPLKAICVTVSWQEGSRRQKVQVVTWQTWR
ncbi:MAG TPA: prepilin-type N-terminal cleavage/methylation domain-containing protein [Oscillospiraceae bacterium]|nr:prepilin-type N-terminal cleavage/methylation domain-containing protein [Oscillospiraceae bacterium]